MAHCTKSQGGMFFPGFSTACSFESSANHNRAVSVARRCGTPPAGATALARSAGHPEHVVGAIVVETPRQHEQVVGQAIDVLDRFRVDWLLGGKPRHAPL